MRPYPAPFHVDLATMMIFVTIIPLLFLTAVYFPFSWWVQSAMDLSFSGAWCSRRSADAFCGR